MFATRKNPTGPDLKSITEYRINLSGADLRLCIPLSNRTDIPEPQGIIQDNVNIYAKPPEGYDCLVLAQRSFGYKGFLGENLGFVQFSLRLFRFENNINLFDLNDLEKQVQDSYTIRFDKWNKEADEDCQLSPPTEFGLYNAGVLKLITYSISELQGSMIRSHYACPLTDDCYIEFLFRHPAGNQENEPWVNLEKKLEILVMESIRLTYTDSAITSQLSVNSL